MLFYNLITSKEGKDDSEGDDAPYDSSLISKQCIICRYFYYTSKNFNNDHKKGNICDGCFHCIVYENENPHLIFRIVTLKNGTFRTVSNYFLSEIEKILENLNITLARDFGWIYKKKLECDQMTEKLSWIFIRNRTAVSRKTSVFPLDYKDLPNIVKFQYEYRKKIYYIVYYY